MRVVLLAIQMVLCACLLQAEDALAQWVGASSAQALRSGVPVTRSIGADGALSLVPPVSARASLGADMAEFRPSVGVEYLAQVGGQATAPVTPADWLRLYNTLHATSSMQGITYWSVTRGRTEVLFSQSYAVASAETRQRIPDPVADSLPARSTFYTLQEDHSFGRNTYQEDFTFGGDNLRVRLANLTTISLALLPVIGPRSFVVDVLLFPSGHNLLFYGAAAVRSSWPLGNRHSREQSLINRMSAMMDWLKARLATGARP